MIPSLLWVGALLVVHEYGHAVVARRQGIFEGYGILPTPHVKISRPYDSKWDYLWGIGASLLTFPIYYFTGDPWWAFFVLAIAAGTIDILILLSRWHLERTGRWAEFEDKPALSFDDIRGRIR